MVVFFLLRAEDEAQTRDPQLGRLMLYQLSYFRIFCLVGSDGFEPPKSKDSRFTVCPIWPLWKLPIAVKSVAKLRLFYRFCNTKVEKSWFFLTKIVN